MRKRIAELLKVGRSHCSQTFRMLLYRPQSFVGLSNSSQGKSQGLGAAAGLEPDFETEPAPCLLDSDEAGNHVIDMLQLPLYRRCTTTWLLGATFTPSDDCIACRWRWRCAVRVSAQAPKARESSIRLDTRDRHCRLDFRDVALRDARQLAQLSLAYLGLPRSFEFLGNICSCVAHIDI